MNLEPLPTLLELNYDSDALVYVDDNSLYYGREVPQSLIDDLQNHSFQIYSSYYTYHKNDDTPRIYLLGRGKKTGKIKVKIMGFYAYCYDYSKNGECVTYLGDRCEKIIFKGQHPSKVKRYRENRVKRRYPQPLEADILMHRRFMIDMYDFFKPTEPIQPKIGIVDIETDHPVSDEIISYAINDLETGELIYESKYDDLNGQELAKNLVYNIQDFDIITGWNFVEFDAPLIEKQSGERLSNIVTMVDLLEISKKMYAREIRGNWGLDNAGSRLCGIAKTLDEKDIKMDIRDLNEDKLLHYNVIDVIIPEIIDEELGGLQGHLIMSWSLQVGIDDVVITAVVNDIALLREYHHAGLVLPSRDYSEEKSKDYGYKAAEPDARPGVYDGIITMDLQHAYPSAVISLNMSPETKDPDGIHVAPNGVRFNDGGSIFIESLKKLMKDRVPIKKKLNSFKKDDSEYKMYKSMDFDLKTEIAALSHGMFGWGFSRVKDLELADAITSMPREIIDMIKTRCDLIGKPWVYCHTDSIFINTSEDEVDSLIEFVNNVINNKCKGYKLIPNMEFKGFYPIGYIHSPARNVLVPVGVDIDDDENWEVSGMNFMRSEVSEPLAEIEIELIKMKLKHKSNDELMSKLKEMLMELPKIESSKLAIVKPLSKPIDKYGKKLLDGSWGNIPYHVKAMIKANEDDGLELIVGNKYAILPVKTSETVGVRVIKMKRVDVAFDLDDKLPDKYEINYDYYLDSNLWGKINGLFDCKVKELKQQCLTPEVCNHLCIKIKDSEGYRKDK